LFEKLFCESYLHDELVQLLPKQPLPSASLPCPIPSTDQPMTDAAPPTSTLPSAHILIAEDNLVNQKVASLYVKRMGMSFEIAENGRIALERMKQERFDAVLMDLHMPEMDGLEATLSYREHERESGKDPRLPIIALTADAIKGDREKCLEAGMDDYLSKPLKMADLQSMLLKHLV